jgi:hypothetical protein
MSRPTKKSKPKGTPSAKDSTKGSIDRIEHTDPSSPAASEISSPSNLTARESQKFLWEQYKIHVDLYKRYLDTSVKFIGFYYLATGAILSFYFTRTESDITRFPDIKKSLLFPIFVSVAIGILFIYGFIELRIKLEVVRNIVRELQSYKEKGKIDLNTVPNFNILGAFLVFTAILLFITAKVLWQVYSRT